MAIEEWDRIQARSNVCNGCQKGFADKEDYHTLLTLTAEGYTRQDLCQPCWTNAGSPDKRAGAASYWVGTFVMPPPPKPETLKREDAESMLRKYIDSRDPGHVNTRYILALMLERKRTLKHRDTTEQDGQKILIYEHARTGETFLVPDPRLRLDQLEAVQAEVVALLTPPTPAQAAVDAAVAAGTEETPVAAPPAEAAPAAEQPSAPTEPQPESPEPEKPPQE